MFTYNKGTAEWKAGIWGLDRDQLIAGLELDQLNFPSGIEHTHDPCFGRRHAK
jgi:hypothetical protein